MASCPTCFEKYPPDVTHCARDGAVLLPDEVLKSVDYDLVPGTAIGEYRVEGKLGEGSFGTVYRAVHPLIGKAAAVKVLSRMFSSNPEMVSRFVAEARAVNQIQHKNIIDIFAFGQLPDGRQYYVMELLEGMTFDRYLQTRGPLSVAAALPVLRGIARAVDAAHAKGILHRDLKPENVFVSFDDDGSPHAKLLDFGLVKLLGSGGESHKTKTGTPMGTPYYMSPEQCRGVAVDGRTDVYAFGAMIFEVLTGQLPFDGEASVDILVKHLTAPPPLASQVAPHLSSALDEPICKMLAKAPADRPASLGIALDMLVRAAKLEMPPSSRSLLAVTALPDPAETNAATAMARTLHGPPESRPTLPRDPARAGADTDNRVALSVPARAVAATPGADTVRSRVLPRTEGDAGGTRRRRPVTAIVAASILVAAGLGVLAFLVAPARRTAGNDASPATAAGPPALSLAPTRGASPPDGGEVANAVAAPAAAEAPSELVELSIVGAPPGARVLADGKELGVGPGPFLVRRGTEVHLTVSAEGFKRREVAVTPTASVAVPVALERTAPTRAAPAHAPPSKKHHSDLEGFDKR